MVLIPGLPPLPPGVGVLFTLPTLLTGDTITSILGVGTPIWGLFDQNNNPVIAADNVVSLDYKQDWKVPNYPIEQGGFSSYDKVATPFDLKMSFTKGGSVSDRSQFLNACEAAGASLDLYTAVSPEAVYPNVNVTMLGVRRTADNGATLITVDFGLTEIRTTATQAFSSVAAPAAANQVNGGTVQPTAPTAAQQSALQSILLQNPNAPNI